MGILFYHFRVSILIFLELPFKGDGSPAEGIPEGFQSLFSWSYLSKLPLARLSRNRCLVSILIFLELPFKVNVHFLSSKMLLRFNPYFPGVTFQSCDQQRIDPLTLEFQSLFSWSYLSKQNAY